jgi:ATP-dependent Clp protease, protease subunit
MQLKQEHDQNDTPELPPSILNYGETYVRLAQHRVIFVSEDITHQLATELTALLLYFDHQDHHMPIEMYINSGGGSGDALYNIHDVMQMVRAPIKTINLGKCYSAGAVMLAAGSKGYRYAFKHSKIMIHGLQCIFPIPGDDITNTKNYHQFLKENNQNVMKIMAKHTGQPVSKIHKDCLGDVWMTAQQGKAYGIIDHII